MSEQRLTDVELKLMHLERDVEALSQVVLSQSAEIDALRKELEKTAARVEAAAEEEKRDLEAEKPPHY